MAIRRLIASVCDETVEEISVFGSVKKFIIGIFGNKIPDSLFRGLQGVDLSVAFLVAHAMLFLIEINLEFECIFKLFEGILGDEIFWCVDIVFGSL